MPPTVRKTWNMNRIWQLWHFCAFCFWIDLSTTLSRHQIHLVKQRNVDKPDWGSISLREKWPQLFIPVFVFQNANASALLNTCLNIMQFWRVNAAGFFLDCVETKHEKHRNREHQLKIAFLHVWKNIGRTLYFNQIFKINFSYKQKSFAFKPFNFDSTSPQLHTKHETSRE